MSDVTRVRIKPFEGEVEVKDVSFGQLCELLKGAPQRLRKEFWAGEESVASDYGNIKILKL